MTPGKKLVYSVVILLVVLLSVFTLHYLTAGKDVPGKNLSEPAFNDTLKVVMNYNPVGYYIYSDTIGGFNYDLVRAIASRNNMNYEITVENDLEKSIKGLENGTYDLIARNIPANISMKDIIAFTRPVLKNRWVLVQRIPSEQDTDSLIRNHLDLARRTIYVPKASPVMLRLQNLSDEIGDTIYIREDSLYDADGLLMKVAAGEIDYAVSDYYTALALSNTIPEVDISTDMGFTHLEAWAVRKSSMALIDSLNNWIERFEQTKEYEKIYKKYFK